MQGMTTVAPERFTVRVGEAVPDFEVLAYANDQIEIFKMSNFAGRWLVLVFYPADFSMVCPTELSELSVRMPDLEARNVALATASMDSVYVHKAWKMGDVRLQKITFPMIADTGGDLCRFFGTYCESDRLSQRGTFIIDPDGVLKSMELQDNSIGRNVDELLRKVDALQFVRENPGMVCPASWTPQREAVEVSIKSGGIRY